MGQAVSGHNFAEFLESIQRFTDEKLIPAERQVEEDEAVPEEIVEEMRRLGLFGMTIPQEYDGLGLSIEQQCLATMEFTRASCVYRARFSTTLGLSSQAILYNGTDDQKREWLPRLADGNLILVAKKSKAPSGS